MAGHREPNEYFTAKATTPKGRSSFDDNCLGHTSGSALQVRRAYQSRTLRVRHFVNRTLRRIHLSRRPVCPSAGELITVTHQHLVDFHSDKTGLSPGLFERSVLLTSVDCAARNMVRWITNCFSPSQGGAWTVHDALSGTMTVKKCMPVVLQHAGHSRTVVRY